MDATTIAGLTFAGIMVTTFVGVRLNAALSDHQLSPETKETVRVGTALVATMTALLLGLLIASAKGSYDTQRSQVIQVAAKVGYLNRVLTVYGPEAAGIRPLLRESTEGLTQRLWSDGKAPPAPADPSIANGPELFSAIHKLAPQNDEQRALKAEALDTVVDIGKARWLLVAQSDTSIPMPLLIIVIVWLAIIFLSFGLFAPTNWTAAATLTIVAVLASSALFLILELDRPFDGAIQVSSAPMRNVLNNLGP